MLILNKNPAGDFGLNRRVPRCCKILLRSAGKKVFGSGGEW